MDRYTREYDFDFNKYVEKETRNMRKDYYGVFLFILLNILKFDTDKLITPQDIKIRSKKHINRIFTADKFDSANRNIIVSQDTNNALKLLQKRIGIGYIKGKREVKKETVKQKMHFGGFPSAYKMSESVKLVKGISSKPDLLRIIIDALLESGLLQNYRKLTFLTLFGYLENIDGINILKVARNCWAATALYLDESTHHLNLLSVPLKSL